MIEKIVLEYLEDVLNVPVYMMRPENVSGQFVLIDKVGGSEQDHLRRAQIAFQSYGDTLLDAATLNESVIEAAKNLATLDEISSSKYTNDYNFTNTADKHPRYQAVFEIYYY